MQYITSTFRLNRENEPMNKHQETLEEWLNSLSPEGFRLVSTNMVAGEYLVVLAIMERADSD